MNKYRDMALAVTELKQEIADSIVTLRRDGYIIKRGRYKLSKEAKKKVKEATRFLETLEKSEYSNCRTVKELCDKMERIVSSMEKQIVSYQSSPVIYHHESMVNRRIDAVRTEKIALLTAYRIQIDWLEKCIAIAKTKDYFNA